MGQRQSEDNTVCRNKKASFRFEFLEQIECGIVLQGTEVKSLRGKNASLDEAYARIDDNEVWLFGFHIAAYSFGNTANHDPLRKRKLLLHAAEIRKLRPKLDLKGLTLIPLRVYFNARGLAKVTLALAKGKTMGDKRESLKAREDRREMERAVRRKP